MNAALLVSAGLTAGRLVREAACMPGQIMTEVSAIVPGERFDDVPAAFAELMQRPLPPGLLRTELLAGRDGEWKIQSLWRDQAALDAMRAGAEPPAAPALFRRLGAEPVLRIFELWAGHAPVG